MGGIGRLRRPRARRRDRRRVSPRQPGSALKPFTYALAFESGDSPATVLADVPSRFRRRKTASSTARGTTTGSSAVRCARGAALAGSENVPAVALASRVGVPDLLRFLRRAGLTTLDKTAAHYGLGLTLGDAEVRLDELVAAYAAFARGGDGDRAARSAPASTRDRARSRCDRSCRARTAFWITDILSDAEARAYAFGRGSSLDFPFPVAAKTGTSQAYHDNWAVGYTRDVTVGVWVGNFDRTPLPDRQA